MCARLALGVLEDEYETAADDAEEPVLESVPEEADEPAAAEVPRSTLVLSPILHWLLSPTSWVGQCGYCCRGGLFMC